MKKLIWCEVKCLRCGCVANSSDWYSPEQIKKLKLETRDWVENDDYSVLCPECDKILKGLKLCK